MKNVFPIIILLGVLISCTEGSKKTTAENKSKKNVIITDSTIKKKKLSPYVMIRSALAGKEVVENLKKGISEKGLTIFSEMAHHDGAEKVGQKLPFTYVIVFGNPKTGAKLMKCDQKIGLELPLKILVSTTAKGKTRISYTNPIYYNENFKLDKCKKLLNKMEKMLRTLTKKAAKNNRSEK